MKKYFIPLLVAMTFSGLNFLNAQIYTFTNAGATGRLGPTQIQCDAAYGPGVVTVSTQGIQQWVVPATGAYSIRVAGGQGGDKQDYLANGGKGQIISNTVNLTAGQVIKIIVGQQGGQAISPNSSGGGGGGGGSFVYDNATNTLYTAAGGGGGIGAGNSTRKLGRDASTLPASGANQQDNDNGPTSYTYYPANGNGGASYGFVIGPDYDSGGGAGWLANGQNGVQFPLTEGGKSRLANWLGGNFDASRNPYVAVGGFGGGGGASDGGGGGGGYTGGNGGRWNGLATGGGGGTCYDINNTNPTSLGLNTGMGSVVITRIATTNTYNYTGSLQTFTVPACVYSINATVKGAQGGSVTTTCAATGGLGASMSGDISVTPGEVLTILVGQQGLTNGSDAGGGGGSFLVRTGNVPLIVAGGGGGATNNIGACGSNRNGINATITTSGTASGDGLIAGGSSGNGGGASTGSGGGGGGFLTDGVGGTGTPASKGKSYLNLGIGGTGNNADFGGYGGGGAGWFTGGNGGGGGGYSGGATSGAQPFTGGGGGGSYNIGTSPVNLAGAQTGNGVVIIVYSPGVPTPSAITGPTSFCVGSSVTYSITSISGATTYNWTLPAGSTITAGAGTNSITVTGGSTSGNVSVTVTLPCGTTTASTLAVTANPLPTVTASSTASAVCAGGSVTLTGGGASTYTWSGGVTNAVSFVPVSTLTYTVTGTSAAGCVNTATTTVTVNPIPTVTANTTATAVCTGSSVTLTGGGASTYAWSGGVTNAVSFVPVSTLTYTVTGTSAVGCTNTATVTVTVNPLPTVTANSTASTVCAGGSVTLTGGGASTYAWSGGVTNAVSFVPVSTLTYTVTGTSAAGCTNTATTTVTVNALPTVTANSTSAAVCMGGSVTLTGGGASTYTWDNSVMDGVSFMPTATMTYMVTGTDFNGCVNTATTTVTVNALPTVTANSTSTAVCMGGSVTLTGGGASTYTWDNSVVDAVSFVPTATTTYMVTGTDVNGCVNTTTTTVTVNALPTVSLGVDTTQCGGTVTLDAGNVGATYLWSDASTAQMLTASTTGNYYVAVTDVNGCVNGDTVMVTINTAPTVTGTAASSVVCVDDAAVALTGTPAGGTWSGPGVTGSSFSPIGAGVGAQTATYTYTDANNCTGTASAVITVNACVGVVESTLENGVNVYPNPNTGSFTLSVNANVGDMSIEMTDMQGRVVYSSVENNVTAGFTKLISMENVANGVYTLRMTTATEQQIVKVSVQK